MAHRDDYSRTGTGAYAPLTIIGDFAFFWGQWPSNLEPAPFIYNGTAYSCVEQWMMSQKAWYFGDEGTHSRIMGTADPFQQKKLGRKVRGFDEKAWALVRESIVLAGTLEKYRQNEPLRKLLLATGDLQFVEASPSDRIWGIGVRSTSPHILNTSRWGLNLLGKIITTARNTLRNT